MPEGEADPAQSLYPAWSPAEAGGLARGSSATWDHRVAKAVRPPTPHEAQGWGGGPGCSPQWLSLVVGAVGWSLLRWERLTGGCCHSPRGGRHTSTGGWFLPEARPRAKHAPLEAQPPRSPGSPSRPRRESEVVALARDRPTRGYR